MATEAEAAREVRAKVIAAESEMGASHSLKEASNVISTSPAILQTYSEMATMGSRIPWLIMDDAL